MNLVEHSVDIAATMIAERAWGTLLLFVTLPFSLFLSESLFSIVMNIKGICVQRIVIYILYSLYIYIAILSMINVKNV